MTDAPLKSPKEVEIETADGDIKTFVVGKFTAIHGRKIMAIYPVSALPKIGNYEENESIMYEVLGYAAVVSGDKTTRLKTKVLVENHVPDWETLIKLEKEIMEYNCSFLANGKALDFLQNLKNKAEALTIQMLTDLSARSSQANKQPSGNLKKSTP